MDNLQIIILAAGHGKRMGAEIPKVLLPLKEIPLVKRLISSVEKSNIKKPPIIVVGQGADLVKSTLGDKYNYVTQDQQLGTGHAVKATKTFIGNSADHVMVLYGDQPMMSHSTINNIAETHIQSGNVITMATVKVDNFDDWRATFFDYGRIIRNAEGHIEKIIEKKDANESELAVTEVNPSYFCFKTSWLWENLDKLDNNNAQNEYYLTSLPYLAKKEGSRISTVSIEPEEALGANTPEQFKNLEVILNSRL